MGNSPEEKYEYYITELQKQMDVFEITVEHRDFATALRLWNDLGKGLPIDRFHFAPKDKLSLREAIFYYEKDALRDPVTFGDFFASCR